VVSGLVDVGRVHSQEAGVEEGLGPPEPPLPMVMTWPSGSS
jgi:hypothetical protein